MCNNNYLSTITQLKLNYEFIQLKGPLILLFNAKKAKLLKVYIICCWNVYTMHVYNLYVHLSNFNLPQLMFDVVLAELYRYFSQKTAAAQNGVALRYRSVRGLYFLAVVFVRSIQIQLLIRNIYIINFDSRLWTFIILNISYLYVCLSVYLLYIIYTVVAHMLVTARKNYSMIYAYAVSFIECIDTHN